MVPIRNILVLILVTYFRVVPCATADSNLPLEANNSRNVVNEPQQSAQDRGGNSFTSKTEINLSNRGEVQSSSSSGSHVSVVPSFAYQFHTNDHEHLDRIVLTHQESNTGSRGGGSFSSNVGTNRSPPSGSGGVANLGTLSNDFSASRRADTSTNFQTYASTLSSQYYYNTPSSTPSYRPQQNQDWRGPYVNSYNGDLESKQHFQLHYYQQEQPQVLSTPQAGGSSQGTTTPHSQINVNHGSSQENVLSSSSGGGSGFVDSRRRDVSLPAGQRRQRPGLNGLKRRKPVLKNVGLKNNSITTASLSSFASSSKSSNGAPLVYSRPPESHRRNGNVGPIPHYQGYQQLHASGKSLNSHNITSPPAPSYSPAAASWPVSMKQKSTSHHHSPSGKKRKILTSRADNYQPYEEMEEDDDMTNDDGADHYQHDHYENVVEDSDNDDDGDEDVPYYFGQLDIENPALRDFGQFGAGAGVGAGAGIQGPLPPPPAPQKGSIDYILIPLILIGLAGPVFVVLYVVLGAFEFKIAPIARSLKGGYTEYQPYIDSVTTYVGRALEKYECADYATCKFRGFWSQYPLLSSNNNSSIITINSIESVFDNYVPEEYRETFRGTLDSFRNLGNSDNCEKYQCSSLLTQLPAIPTSLFKAIDKL